jgi:hypothetical protein
VRSDVQAASNMSPRDRPPLAACAVCKHAHRELVSVRHGSRGATPCDWTAAQQSKVRQSSESQPSRPDLTKSACNSLRCAKLGWLGHPLLNLKLQ